MNLRPRRPLLGIAAALAIAAASSGGLLAHRIFAQEKPPHAAPAPSPDPCKEGDLGGELVAALQHSPGCLGVEAGMMKSGKLSIFAWFQDKKAVLNWYYGDAHQSAMGAMAAGIEASQRAKAKSAPNGAPTTGEPAGGDAKSTKHVPLEFVQDGTGPILCVATITPSEKPQIPGFPIAIRQISIELYQPLPGGVSVGGTFAPASMPLQHHLRVGMPPDAANAEKDAPAAPAPPSKKG